MECTPNETEGEYQIRNNRNRTIGQNMSTKKKRRDDDVCRCIGMLARLDGGKFIVYTNLLNCYKKKEEKRKLAAVRYR